MNARASSDRDQDATPFSEILTELCHASGARCAALVDREGETVDYAGQGDPFDIRILAAEWRLLLQHTVSTNFLRHTSEILVRSRKKGFFVEALPEGYALVIELPRRCTGISARALCQARQRLCEEAGFPDAEDPRGNWSRVSVEEEPGAPRPARMVLDHQTHDVTVLGRITDPKAPREKSFRVRLSSGEECTLVREPFGYWYLEEEPWAPPSRVR